MLGSLAKGSTNRTISLKINTPQSSGRKPSLIATGPSWHGHRIPREALESYQARGGTTLIVPCPKDLGDNCKLKHHQRGILIEASLTSGHLQNHTGFHYSEKFPCPTREPLLYSCRPSFSVTDIQISAFQREDFGRQCPTRHFSFLQ